MKTSPPTLPGCWLFFLGLLSTDAFAVERATLRAFNGGPEAPIDLPFRNEGFFVRFDPATDQQFSILQASVWICSEGDPGWPYPDRWHQSFAMAVYNASEDGLGAELFRLNVLADDNFPSWVTIQPNVQCTGMFYVGIIQAGDHPYVEAVMHDGNVDFPDMHYTNQAGEWGRSIDKLGDFRGDLLVQAVIERPSAVLERLGADLPSAFTVSAPHPNPFNDAASIDVTMAQPGDVAVRIFSLDGRFAVNPTIYQLNVGAHRLPISLSKLPAGGYRLWLESRGEAALFTLIYLK